MVVVKEVSDTSNFGRVEQDEVIRGGATVRKETGITHLIL